LQHLTLQFGFREEKVGETFGLRQIHPAIGKCAAGEFPWLGKAHTRPCEQHTLDRSDDRPATVAMQFRTVLAGRIVRSWQPQNQRFVDQISVRISQAPQAGAARRGNRAGNPLQGGMRMRPADTDHPNRRRRRTAGQGDNGIAARGNSWMFHVEQAA
jgi:hypothetical protein